MPRPRSARVYDEAVYAASHNAMAATAAGFVGAVQDPDLTGQLDAGVSGTGSIANPSEVVTLVLRDEVRLTIGAASRPRPERRGRRSRSGSGGFAGSGC